ncbi:MAG TPA: GvpL/GvpF family gas vesicle protein [Micromonosporaceae bacterium]
MSASAQTGQAQPGQQRVGWYIYGITTKDVEINSGAPAVGDPPGKVEVVRHGDVAALVSQVDVDRPLGRPDDLLAHERLLDGVAAKAPVLPIRFGAVVASREAVLDELLTPHGDEFARALREIEGRFEYLVRAKYVERAVVGEVLSENPTVAQLRERLAGQPEEATRDERIQLGQMIAQAVEAKRTEDTQKLIEAVESVVVANAVRPPSNEFDTANIAFLVERERQSDFENALQRVAADWDGRVTLRLLGPVAPYDFVQPPAPPQ